VQNQLILGLTQENILTFLLTIFRIAGLMAIAPVLAHRLIPAKLRLLLSLILHRQLSS
jgi:flagellar biosynthesis protein FliR